MSEPESPLKVLLLRLRIPVFFLACIGIVLGVANVVADKDNIVVATLNGEDITRGKLTKVLRDMPDVDRPLIQNKGDLIRALNAYLDGEVKRTYAEELEAEGTIKRQRQAATAQYFRKYPDKLSVAEVAKNFSTAEQNALLADIEYGIDAEEELILREQALVYMIQEAVREGTLTISEEEFRQEYERETTLNPSAFQHFEYVIFDAVRFDLDSKSLEKAAEMTRRVVDSGEPFDTIIDAMEQANPKQVMRSAELRNDPASTRFAAFWGEVTETKDGAVHGPVVLPSYKTIRQSQTGESVEETVPDSYLVLKVLTHVAPRVKTWEEARVDLSGSIYVRKMMDRLRTTHGVEIFPDDLPNPAGYGDQFKGSTITINR